MSEVAQFNEVGQLIEDRVDANYGPLREETAKERVHRFHYYYFGLEASVL